MTRTAQRVAARFLRKIAAKVAPLLPEDVKTHFGKALRSLQKHVSFDVVQSPSPVRNPEQYDLVWMLELDGDVIVVVMISYWAPKGVRIQVTENRHGKIDRILDETLTRGSQYKLMIESCLSHLYDRKLTPW